MAKRYLLDGRHFATQKAAKEEIDRIRLSTPHNVPLVHGKRLIMDLLSLHPNCVKKTGVGIDYLFVGMDGLGTNPCFYVKRLDGSFIDFSVMNCLKQSGRTFEQKLRAALRDSVQFHSVMYKNAHFDAASIAGVPPCCSISGEPIMALVDAQADHYPIDFYSIAESFKAVAKMQGLVIDECSVVDHPTCGTKLKLKDDDLRDLFVQYHFDIVMADNYKGFRLVGENAHLRNSNLGSKRVAGSHHQLYVS